LAFFVAAFGDVYDNVKHQFLFNLLLDACLVFGFVATIHRLRRGGSVNSRKVAELDRGTAEPDRLTTLLVSRSIKKLEFEWHDAKADANLQSHGVSFDLAMTVFSDPFAVERLDDREDYGEERFVIIGTAEGNVVLFVAYAEREQRIRIISARRATQYEQDDYFRQNS
jgi:uncharacterized DUF497 family protein